MAKCIKNLCLNTNTNAHSLSPMVPCPSLLREKYELEQSGPGQKTKQKKKKKNKKFVLRTKDSKVTLYD